MITFGIEFCLVQSGGRIILGFLLCSRMLNLNNVYVASVISHHFIGKDHGSSSIITFQLFYMPLMTFI